MGESFFILACMGSKKVKIFTKETSCLYDLNIQFEENFSICRDNQKVIYKGKLLVDREATLLSLGVKKGDTVMVLGKVVHAQKDVVFEELDKYEKQFKEEESLVSDIVSSVGNSYHGEKNQMKIKASMKKLLCANEKLMKLLETIDGMEIKVSSDDIRGKRKSIVQNIQKLMDNVDKHYNNLQSNVKGS